MPEKADESEAQEQPVLRVSLDVNIWVTYLMALQRGRREVASVTLVDAVRSGRIGRIPIQLAMSLEMLGTLERVLVRLEFPAGDVDDFFAAIVDLMKSGPEGLDPHLLISGRDQLPMRDREDAGVLASAMAARVDLLVTNNLNDFQTRNAEIVETRQITSTGGGHRRLHAVIHERSDGVALVSAHPFDAVEWLRNGLRPSPDNIRGFHAVKNRDARR